MRRVTGIGGIFFKSWSPETLRAWYQRHLGLDVQARGGAVLPWADEAGNPSGGTTVWSVSSADTEYYAPSTAPFMVNYRVAALASLVDTLRAEGCDVMEKTEDSEFGKFGWVMDPDGNNVELWEPPAGQ